MLRSGQGKLIEIRADSTRDREFKEKDLVEFWLMRQQVIKFDVAILMWFVSSLYETAFAYLLFSKKHRSVLSNPHLNVNLQIRSRTLEMRWECCAGIWHRIPSDFYLLLFLFSTFLITFFWFILFLLSQTLRRGGEI